jgi:mobilome CxxCx(11)CxxC protein
MNTTQKPNDLVKHCIDRAFYAYGTSRIFERRAQNLGRKRNAITFLGIAVPLTVGSLILSFGTMPSLLPFLVWIAGAIGTVQLILSLWSIVAHWDEQYSYAITAMLANTRLYNSWERLSKNQPPNLKELISETDAEDQRQEQSDLTQHISEKEKHFAMRASLYYKGCACVTCNIKPASMKPSNCDTCGNF